MDPLVSAPDWGAATYTLLSVALVSLVSLIGAATLSGGVLRRHGTVMFLVALAAGTLVGDTFLHILPEASHEGFTTDLALWIIGGFLLLFALEIGLRWQHSHADIMDPHHHEGVKPFGIVNLVGDALHNLLDGVIIAAAYLVDVSLGIATTAAVLLHEVPQELGDYAVLVSSGFSTGKALMLNLGSAMVAFVGAAFVLLVGLEAETLETVALPLVAGGFLYIAAADLVPELHHHSHRRDQLMIMAGFVLGILAMWGLTGLEGAAGDGHAHG